MKTITETIILFSSFEDILENSINQVSAQNLIDGRLNLKNKGWSDICLTPDLRVLLAEKVSALLGGRSVTRRNVEICLIQGRPQHWGLGRIYLEKYENDIFFSYCAGQDYPAETARIRKYLAN